MTSTSIAKRISPMLATADMEETMLFYESVLGFTPTMKSAEYSIVERDGQTMKTFRNRYSIRDLFDREYGMTEFHIADPNGCLVFVGEPTLKRN
jgi:catechol-2,3-dioxygenase